MDGVDENNEPASLDRRAPLRIKLCRCLHQAGSPHFVEMRTDIHVMSVMRFRSLG